MTKPIRKTAAQHLFENQKYQDGSTSPVAMFAVADGHSNRNGSWAFVASVKSTEDGGALGQMVTERIRDAFQAVPEDFPSDCWSTQEDVLSKRLEDQGETVDESIRKSGLGTSRGTTFSFALVTASHVALGNVGDSVGCYSCFDGGGSDKFLWPDIAMTFGVDMILNARDEHSRMGLKKTVASREIERVEKAGFGVGAGNITNEEGTSLACTRAFGDLDFKMPAQSTSSTDHVNPASKEGEIRQEPGVIARPVIRIFGRNKSKKNHEVVALFTDGIAFPGSNEAILRDTLGTCILPAIESGGPDLWLVASNLHNSANSRRARDDNAGLDWSLPGFSPKRTTKRLEYRLKKAAKLLRPPKWRTRRQALPRR